MCTTQNPPLGSGGSRSSGGAGEPSAAHAAVSALGRFSRCRHNTAGPPAATTPRTRSVRASPPFVPEEDLPERRESAKAASASTFPPKATAYGRTLSVQRSAGELRTLALGAKQGSSPVSASASASPLASSGR